LFSIVALKTMTFHKVV